MPHTPVCTIADERTTFLATADEARLVDQLKQTIIDRADLDVPTLHLTLYQVMVDISNDDQYDEIVQGISPDQYLSSKLNSAYHVSKYFGEANLPEI